MRFQARAPFAVAVLGSFAIVAACGRSDESPVPVQSAATPGSTKLVGCVAQTGQPDLFLLSVAVPRDAQTNSPSGTPVPHDDRVGASAAQGATPSGPVATSGGATPGNSASAGASSGPGAGPTTTTKIATYRLVGAGAADMAAHVGGTVEVTGSIQELPSRGQPDAEQINGEFQVESARPVSKDCVR